MNIGISSQTYLSNGGAVVNPLPDSDLRRGERRVSRVKTLDGGVYITDSGFAHGDRTQKLYVAHRGQAMWNALWTIFRGAPAIYLSTEEGCFSAALANIADEGDKIVLEILLKEKLSE